MERSPTRADEILSCTHALIVKGGYNGFSYADISAVVGIRKATIHHHFPAKSDLVQALVAQYRAEANAGLDALERNISDPLERLRAYFGYWEDCIADSTQPFCVCALLATEIPLLPEDVAIEVRAHFRSVSTWLATVLERGAAQGGITFAGTPEANAEMILATVHGAMASARAYGDPALFATITESLLQRFVA